jgi:hypothetical protein
MSINLKTTVSIPTEVSIELETPAFFKDIVSSNITVYLGVFDECTIRIFSYPGERTCLQNDATKDVLKDVKKAVDEWEHIDEDEFMDALNKALEDFNFKIGYKETALQADAEMERRSEQW